MSAPERSLDFEVLAWCQKNNCIFTDQRRASLVRLLRRVEAGAIERCAQAVTNTVYCEGVEKSLALRFTDQERAKHYAAWTYASNRAVEAIRSLLPAEGGPRALSPPAPPAESGEKESPR